MSFPYRSEIDGLRALAVVPVLFFHAGFAGFGGGFVGVDIFFVISGYLITRILLEEQQKQSFTYMGFYERRARRILPALLFVTLVTVVPSYYLMVPDQAKDFSLSLLSVVAFVSNFFFMSDTGYFGAVAGEKPLLHTWSLGVEEQYYLVMPIIIAWVWKRRPEWLGRTFIGIAAFSFVVALLGAWWNAEANFFFTPSRFWELMVGSWLGLRATQQTFHMKHHQAQLLSLAGLVSIVLSIGLFDAATPSPSHYMLLPVLGAAAVIVAASPTTWVGKLLSTKWMAGVGLISFSLYLWHQPLFALARIVSLQEPDPQTFAYLIVASFILAWLTWRWIEKPFRNRLRMKAKKMWMWVLIGSLVVAALGWVGYFYSPASHVSLLRNRKAKQIETWKVFLENPAYQEAFQSFEPRPTAKLLIIGDSHSKDLFNSLFIHRQRYDSNFQFRHSGFAQSCFGQNPDLVMQSRTDCNLQTRAPLLFQQSNWIVLSFRWGPEALSGLADWVGYWQQQGKRVALVGRTAEFPNSPKLLHEIYFDHQMSMPAAEEVAKEFASQRHVQWDRLNEDLRKLAQQTGAAYLDKLDFACNTSRSQCWAITPSGVPVHYDYGHLTLEGAEFLGAKMWEMKWLENGLTQATSAQ